jgi:hypothetical protein
MENELQKSADTDRIKTRYQAMLPMDEPTTRKWAGSEALAIGRGGETRVSEATGISRTTIRRGIKEIKEKFNDNFTDIRYKYKLRSPGGGRKRLTEQNPSILADLHGLIDPVTSGDPMSNVKWTSSSTYKLSEQLNNLGYKICPDSVGKLLKEENYSLQANLKTIEGKPSPERDYQFKFIENIISEFQCYNQPIISIDAKKKELIGNFSNKGREWHKKGEPIKVNVYDFLDLGQGKVTPYGIYDLTYNEGLVNIGINHDTAEFATATIDKWWQNIGIERYNKSVTKLLILADGGGSNSSRSRLWKYCLQNLANKFQFPLYISHYPPGTSKYNKIEHRMFSYISINWRGKPLTTFSIILNLIANTTTVTGLKIYSMIDYKNYDLGIKISEEDFNKINITYNSENKLNYFISPIT